MMAGLWMMSRWESPRPLLVVIMFVAVERRVLHVRWIVAPVRLIVVILPAMVAKRVRRVRRIVGPVPRIVVMVSAMALRHRALVPVIVAEAGTVVITSATTARHRALVPVIARVGVCIVQEAVLAVNLAGVMPTVPIPTSVQADSVIKTPLFFS